MVISLLQSMSKSLIVPGLSLMIIPMSFHLGLYHLERHEGFSICNIDCGNERHHYPLNHCEKCLIKNNESLFQNSIELSFDFKFISFKSVNKWPMGSSTIFSPYSRPPPKYFI